MKKKVIGLSIALFLSVVLNLFFLLSDGLFYWKQKKLAKICNTESKHLTNKRDFYDQIIPASL